MRDEAWRDVVGYEALYEVSNRGRVRNAKTGRIHKAFAHQGYPTVTLTDGPVGYRRQRSVHVHRLVARAFIGRQASGIEVRHLDGDPSNNWLENLAYGTPKDNAKDRERHGRTLRGELHGSSKLSDRQRVTIAYMNVVGGIPQRAVAREFGVSQCCVQGAVAYVRNHLGGDSAAAIKSLYEAMKE